MEFDKIDALAELYCVIPTIPSTIVVLSPYKSTDCEKKIIKLFLGGVKKIKYHSCVLHKTHSSSHFELPDG